jgi:hypothetical protein
MGRKRSRGRSGKRSGGGALSSLRGGFKSTVRGATGAGQGRPQTSTRRLLSNLLTIALVVAAAVLLARRFGVFR